jgi:hypothetical protein
MGKKGKKSSRNRSAKKQTRPSASTRNETASADGNNKETQEKSAASKEAKLKEPQKPPEGINRIPYWLKHEKGFSDFTAGIIVLLTGGLIITVVTYLLTILWPAH